MMQYRAVQTQAPIASFAAPQSGDRLSRGAVAFEATFAMAMVRSRFPAAGRQVRNLIFDWLEGDIASRCGKLAGFLPLPQPQVLRHATRMTVAAILAFAAAWALALPEVYWAVISAVVVIRSSLGGTQSLDAGF